MKIQQRRIGNLLRRTRACIAILLAIAIVGEPGALTHASPYIWTGAENSNWDSSSGNWSDGVDPVLWQNGNTAVFNGSMPGTIGVSFSIVVAGIEVSSSGYSFTGGSIDFGYSGASFQIDDDVTIGSTLSGGTLIKTGNGSLTLSSNFNSYSGGVTVSAGALVGTTDSLRGDITNNALVTFDQSFDGAYSGSMSGNGSLTKMSSGAVRLSGNNSYNGGTTVTAGTLIGTTSSLQGDMTNNGIVTFDQSVDGTYSGLITGGGGVTKIGSGAVTFSANNGYTGATAVNGGQLLVDGQLGNTAVSVASGGLLGGSGTILGDVTIDSSGTMSPGNSPGILTVGSLSLLAGSHTVMEITGTSSSLYDQLVGTGAATLSYGGSLELVMSGSYADQTTFHLFSNFGSRSGDFDAVGLTTTGEYTGLTFSDQSGVWTSTWTTNHQRLVFSTITGDLVVVPEPSTYALMAIGAGIVGLMRRRKRLIATASVVACPGP